LVLNNIPPAFRVNYYPAILIKKTVLFCKNKNNTQEFLIAGLFEKKYKY